jgi:hypothetical protein
MESSLKNDLLDSYELNDIIMDTRLGTQRVVYSDLQKLKGNIIDFFIKYFDDALDRAYKDGRTDGEKNNDSFDKDVAYEDEYDRGYEAGKREAKEDAKRDEESETTKAKREFYELTHKNDSGG